MTQADPNPAGSFIHRRNPRPSGSRLLVERLENRRLLASAAEPLAGGFAATVNFQPQDAGPVAFTRADFGRPFATRGNGLTYGWDRDLEAAGDLAAVESDGPLPGLAADDRRYETFARVEAGDGWSIEVPDGSYVVNLNSGDPGFDGRFGDARIAWEINGVPAVNAFPTARYPWGEAVAFVQVTDGRIRLTAAAESEGDALLWARVAQIEPPPDYAAGQSVDWQGTALESPISRIEPGVVRFDNKVFVIGGFTEYYAATTRRVDILDLDTLTWSEGAPLPADAAETHAGVALDEANGQIYWLGGQFGTSGSDEGAGTFDTTRAGFRYDVAADGWTRVFDTPKTAYAPGAAVIDGTLRLFGGSDVSRIHPLSDHYAIDLAAYAADPEAEGATWQDAAPMPLATDHFAVSTLDGKITVLGGEYSHSVSYVPRREVQIYDPATDAWTLGQPMPVGVSHIEGTTVERDGRLWVLAGKQLGNRGTQAVQSYDPAADEWRTHNALGLFRFGGIAFERGGRFYYLAGDDFNNQLTRGGVEGDVLGA